MGALKGAPVSLAKAKENLIAKGNDTGIDMVKYKIYVEQQKAKGLKPLPPKSWAIAHLTSDR